MSTLEILLENNNNLLKAVLQELQEIKNHANGQDLKTCSPSQAMAIIGVNNSRYLTYFFKAGLLNRRKGGTGFLYFKTECQALAEKITNKEILLPNVKGLYGKE